MTDQQNNNNKKPSAELTKLLIDIKTTIEKLKGLYDTTDKKASEEGYSTDEIYDFANNINVVNNIITTTTNTQQDTQLTNNNNNNNNNNNIFYSHFQ